jgi:hypothetical protein
MALTSGDSVAPLGLDVAAYVRQAQHWSAIDGTPMDKYPPEAWQRLGRALERRRGQLGYGFRQRERFANDAGLVLSAKTLARLENGERDAYPEATLAVAEVVYQWAPGSIEQVLKGGEAQPLDGPSPQDAYRSAADAAVQHLLDDPEVPDDMKHGAIDIIRRIRDSGPRARNGTS